MRRTAILTVLCALALAACSAQEPEVTVNEQVPAGQQVAEDAEGGEGGEGGGGAPAADFASAAAVWVAEQLAFTDAPSTVPAGETVIGLQIIGGLPHNVVFEGYEGDRPLVEGNGEGEFAAAVTLEPGDYTYYCAVPGHRAAGMEGQVTVS